MVRPLDTPIVCPVLVGRAGDLAALRGCLDEAIAGRGQTVLVAGEAGIGKSRLVAEAATYARDRGIRVLVGQCFEPDRSLPFAAVLDMLRGAAPPPPGRLGDAFAAAAADLLPFLPELARWVPGATPSPSLGPEHDRWRAVHAVTLLVGSLAANQPLLLVIEDAHWSDEATLAALLHLARSRRDGPPVVLVITYRSDEVGPDLAGLLAALDRERLAAEIRLEPLAPGDVDAMLRAMGERVGGLPPALVDEVAALAEGNPFFVEELLRSTLAGDHPGSAAIAVPRSVDDAVRRRAGRLDDGARRTLTLAAVAGRRFDFALLQALGGGDQAETVRRVKELIRAGLVVEGQASAMAPDGRFAFRHELMRHAIYAGLLVPERRAGHRAVLDAMRRRATDDPDRHAADLARHAYEGGVWKEAVVYGRRAGEEALARYAPRAAVEHFSRAIEAAARLGSPAPPVLHRRRGHAFDTLGDFDAARRDFETAVKLARTAGDRVEEGEAQLALGQLWLGRDYGTAGAYLHAARDAAAQAGNRLALARCLNRLGNWHLNLDRPADAFRCHEDALAIFEDTGDRRGIAETLDLLGIARYLAGDVAGSAAAYRRAIDLLRALDDRQTLVNALAILGFTIGAFDNREVPPADGSDEESRRFLDEAIALARAIGWRPGEAFALCCLGCVEGRSAPTQALATARRALRIADDLGHTQWRLMAHNLIGQLHAALLDLQASQQELELTRELAKELNSAFWNWTVAADLASVLVHRGDLQGASDVLDPLLDDGAPFDTWTQRRAWLARAELALAQGRPGPTLDIVDRLLAAAGIDAATGAQRTPHLAHLRGRALIALGRLEEAAIALRSACDGALARGLPLLLWRVHLALGDCARRLGDRAQAAREDAAARVVLDALAATIEDQAQRDRFVRNALAHFPGARPPSSRQAAKAAFGGLTERERDVAALVAAGRSNREIGEALFTTERTAATHVGNILAKLGLKSRAQIAVWANERGLTQTDGA